MIYLAEGAEVLCDFPVRDYSNSEAEGTVGRTKRACSGGKSSSHTVSRLSVRVWAMVHSRATGWDGVLRESILRAIGESSLEEELRIAYLKYERTTPEDCIAEEQPNFLTQCFVHCVVNDVVWTSLDWSVTRLQTRVRRGS